VRAGRLLLLRARYLRAGLWTNGSQSRTGIEINKAMEARARNRRVKLQRQQVVSGCNGRPPCDTVEQTFSLEMNELGRQR
jgi:hypothetical protein